MKQEYDFVPLKLKEAQSFVELHHRHSKPLERHRFSIGAKVISKSFADPMEAINGVVTVDNCSSAWSKNYDFMEIRRLCVLDGHKNLASQLLGRACTACFAMGASLIVTYTKPYESCSSLLASGFRLTKVKVSKSPERKARGLLRWTKGKPDSRYDIKDDRKLLNKFKEFIATPI